MRYLNFDSQAGAEGETVLEAVASTAAAQHAAVLQEAQAVLDWAQQHFADTQGALEDGHDWHHELQVWQEPGGWHAVALTLVVSPRFAEGFWAAFGAAEP